MTAHQPVEARCDHCKQLRPLFRFVPEHAAHFNPALFATCRWCTRAEQPLLCIRCHDAEALLEENDPGLAQEAETMRQICETNARIEARRQAIRTECDGISEATRAAEETTS